jgi:uncharacterized protein (TIGR00266 family)
MKYEIIGNNLQLVKIEIEQNEKIFAEAGSLVYMTNNINMEAKMRGGFLSGLGRKLAGETLFLTEFKSDADKGLIAFGGRAPGTIKKINISPGMDFIVQKDAFLCAENSIDISIAFQKRLGSIFFGGEGFILEKISGNGNVFIHACGDFIEIDLKTDEIIKVDTGSVVGWDSTVSYSIERVKGIKTILFGGEGLFLTTLKGPGHIIIQSMDLGNLASALMPFMPHQTSGNQGFKFG